MTIGRSSRSGSARGSIRAPKFLDKSGGFYDRLREPEAGGERDGGSCGAERGEAGGDFGLMEDDGQTLLQRDPCRRSSRWRRSSRRKQRVPEAQEGQRQAQEDQNQAQEDQNQAQEDQNQAQEDQNQAQAQTDPPASVLIQVVVEPVKETDEDEARKEGIVHFTVRERGDQQVLIGDKKKKKKRGREEEEEDEEERRMRREQEEGMKVVKRNTLKDYRKAVDRALRRGWEAFITNLHSVTITPGPYSSSPPCPLSPASKKKQQHCAVLAEFQ